MNKYAVKYAFCLIKKMIFYEVIINKIFILYKKKYIKKGKLNKNIKQFSIYLLT